MKRLLTILALLCCPMWATTYYIDNCVVTGNDSNNGTATGTPWLTIAHVNAQTFSAGDSVLFQSTCTWHEQVAVPSSGSAGNQIVFGSYGTGAMPILNGANVETGWTATPSSTTVSLQVGAGHDDCTSGDTPNCANTYVYTNSTASANTGGFRFTGVTIPQGATITSATFSGYVYSSSFKYINTTIYGEASNTALTFNGTNGYPNTRSKTTANVVWNVGGGGGTVNAFNNAPDVSTIIQEIVNRAGWASGNALAILLPAPITAGGGGTVTSYDGTPANAAKLSITYANTGSPIAHVYQVTLATQPTQVFKNNVLQTQEASLGALTGDGEWYWGANTLYVYDVTGNPDTASDLIEASIRKSCVYWNAKNYVTVTNTQCVKAGYDGLYMSTAADSSTPSSTTGGGNVASGNFVTQAYVSGIRSIYMTSLSAPIQILNNEVSYSGLGCAVASCAGYYDGIEIQSVGSSSNYTLVQGNYIHDNSWGIEVDQTSNYTNVLYNVITGSSGGMGFNNDRADHTVFAYNIVYNNGTNWEVRFWSATASTTTGATIIGNTIRGSSAALIVQNEQTSMTVENNLIGMTSGTGDSVSVQTGLTFSGLTWDYNDYYPVAGYFYYGGGLNFSGWNAATLGSIHPDAHGLSVDPKFTDAAAYTLPSDFTLQSGSPAIHAGANLGTTYVYGLNPISSWPSLVTLLPQDGAGWNIGAYIVSGHTLLLLGIGD